MRLYAELAEAYHQMYGVLFDYKKEFKSYGRILVKYGCRSVLEIGCGSGRLAAHFLRAGFAYTGIDLSADMLRIARRENPGARFMQADMRDFSLSRKVDAAIITGRTLSHAVTNIDVLAALKRARAVLKNQGLLVFDAFRAEEMVRAAPRTLTQVVRRGDTVYRRLSRTSLNLGTGWTVDWEAEYRIRKKGRKEKVVRDRTTLRAFTKDELELFLSLSGFEVLEFRRGKVYVLAARKTGGRYPKKPAG